MIDSNVFQTRALFIKPQLTAENATHACRNANNAFMKKLFSLTIAATVLAALTGCNVRVSSLSGGWSDADLKVVTNVIQTAGIPAGLKTLEVDNRQGSIHITGTESGPIGWSQKLTVRARTDSIAQEIASAVSCQAQLDGDHLKLVVSMPDTREPHSFQSDLEITVPKSVSVRTDNPYGRTVISGLNGDVEAAGQCGAVEIRDVGGKVRAHTSYAALKVSSTGPATLRNQCGGIEATGIRGSLDAETSYATLVARDIGGPVKLRNQCGRVEVEKAGDADIKTSYAGLRVKEINGDAFLVNQCGHVEAGAITGSVKANTSYAGMDITGAGSNFVCDNQCGSVSLHATSATLTNLEARTSYAALEVRLPAAVKPAVQARTSYADVESDFPVLMKPRGQDPFADVPPGTARINLLNQSGKIRVVRE
jgi:hypothetical protein